jgi:hypothetical protein
LLSATSHSDEGTDSNLDPQSTRVLAAQTGPVFVAPSLFVHELNPAPTPKTGWVTLLVWAAAGLGIVAFCMWLDSLSNTPYTWREPIPFDREAWLAAADDPRGARYLMLDDLLAKEPLEGRTRAQVEELLGPMLHSIGLAEYYLGPEPSMISVDSIMLRLEFDASGRVAATVLATN